MSKQTELLNLTDGLSVDSSGNVGIGTSSPTADLEISAASNPEISIASTAGATNNFLNFKATSHTQQTQTQLKTEDNGDFTADLAFLFKGTGTAGALSEKMRVTSAGKVGIGQAIPAHELSIKGLQTVQVDLQHTDTSSYSMVNLTETSGTQKFLIGYGSTHNLQANQLALKNTIGDITAYTGGTERMRIDAAGRVTMPYQPAFKAGMNAGTFSTGGGSAQIIYDTTHFDRGGHYNTSTGRYTIPVTGLYEFTHNISARATYTGAYEVKLWQNGVEKHRQFNFGGGNSHGTTATAILLCAQGDYIDARGYWGTSGITLSGDLDAATSAGIATLSYFSGHLIG